MIKKEAVNIYDIAKLSGVSIATVSRVMNGSDKVSEATRRRVLDVIDEVGFTPNVFAQGLGLNTMHTVGILVPTISDLYMSTAVSFLEEELSAHGYDCLLSCSGYEPDGKQMQTELLLSKHIDALILVGSTYAGAGVDPAETEYIRAAAVQVPVFLINGSVEGENIYCSVGDDEAAVYHAATMLLSRGYKQIIFLTDSRSYSSIKKRAGYTRAIEEAGSKSLVLHVENRMHLVRDRLTEEELKFDAAIAATDTIAVGVVKYALGRGMCIPEELAVVGYDNSALAVASEPELSSIDNHTEQICRDTVERMLAVLDPKRGSVRHKLTLACELVERGTT